MTLRIEDERDEGWVAEILVEEIKSQVQFFKTAPSYSRYGIASGGITAIASIANKLGMPDVKMVALDEVSKMALLAMDSREM
jgi:hypothetical protein